MFAGSLPFFNDSVAGTKVVVKAAGGHLVALRLLNTTAAAAYLQMFDKLTAAVTVGTTTPDFTLRLAANEAIILQIPLPWSFVLGLVIAGTTTATGSTGAAISVSALYD